MTETILRNARVVLQGEVVLGSVRVFDGRIESVDTGPCSVASALDLEGDYLLPGLVEIHTDNLERHLMPRPKTRWPELPALLGHDAEVAAAGITTVYDALGVGDLDAEAMRGQPLGPIIAALDEAGERGLLRIDHRLHVRAELPAPNTAGLFAPLEDHPLVGLISLMDHTPGQRQWEDAEHARVYYCGKKGWSPEKFERAVRDWRELQAEFAVPQRRFFVEHAARNGIPLASHDDTVVEHVEAAVAEGVVISEFPTREIAARAARDSGMSIVMGAPNVVRGGSHSGNVSALDLARSGLLDVLSSDYIPASLMLACFRLVSEADFPLHAAVAVVSRNPARALGLTDRGELAPGKRADLVHVHLSRPPASAAAGAAASMHPAVRSVWSAGRRVV